MSLGWMSLGWMSESSLVHLLHSLQGLFLYTIQLGNLTSSVIKGRKASDQPEKGELGRRIERRLVVLSASASTLVCTLLPGSSCSSTTQWINVWLRPTAFPDRRLESGLIRWWCWSIHPPESAEPLLRCIIVHQCKTVHWESELKFSN